NRIPLLIPTASADTAPAFLVQSIIHGIDELDVDVAVAKLDEETVSNILTSHRFLRLLDIELQERQDDALYLVLGYPAKWPTQAAVSSLKPMAFLGAKYTGELNPQLTLDPGIHLLLGYEQDGLSLLHRQPAILPEVHGMSGGGIWRVADWTCDRLTDWNGGNCKLVAIQHSWNRTRRYIKATWIRHALSLIWHHYPALRAAL